MLSSYNYPAFNSLAHVALFDNVTNAKELRSRLISAATMSGPDGELEREAVNFAFVDASLVVSEMHLQTALLFALLADARTSLRTKTVHSEILWALNPTNNISEAIRRFGVSDSTTRLLVVRVCTPPTSTSPENIETALRTGVAGDAVPLSCLSSFTDWSKLTKYYKLPAGVPHERLIQIVESTVGAKSAA
ncbi:CGI-121-domain-containing protein [Exidia glandulosa HHB12029]|uniref:EKC/KEOPS complex subunit CGI121 n=1 Tax=Exidia glandulosa HHB12029 TaxID=1314781 RepID=A0A165DNU7_EXIGL|nr:CGI-121-domain-containing protein [Exidia glandulosa HHB12029]